jgi:hypothetical protein
MHSKRMMLLRLLVTDVRKVVARKNVLVDWLSIKYLLVEVEPTCYLW